MLQHLPKRPCTEEHWIGTNILDEQETHHHTDIPENYPSDSIRSNVGDAEPQGLL